MKTKLRVHNLIYQYFLFRIHFQYYQYGDTLPSIDTLCREFSVSSQTVATALQRLRAEGYIDMHNGRQTRVLFRQTDEEYRAFIRQFFSGRMAAASGLARAVEMVCIPLMTEGFMRMDDKDLAYIAPFVERSGADDVLYLFCYALQKLENPLAMNLFWETSLFLGLMFISDNKEASMRKNMHVREQLEAILSLCKAGDREQVHEALLHFQGSSVKKAFQFIRHSLAPMTESEPVSFVWRIYWERPQICYGLTMRILHGIYLGEYKDAEYLPSYGKMSEKYNVSVSTVRRTIHMLNQTGAAVSVNGVGTRIFPAGVRCNLPDFQSPAVRRNLSLFLQSFEIIAYSCEEVVSSTLLSLTREQYSQLVCVIEQHRDSGQHAFTLWHLLICIATHNPLAGIREIYSKLYGLLLWGYPLKASLPEASGSDHIIQQFSDAIFLCLRNHEPDQCGAAVREMITRLFPVAEGYLLSRGIPAEELRMSPSIRLLLNTQIE
ncbi:GntR family transcriptional regulator [Lachnoclostridium pacaense]|uniref:GntR family transcriptional regulator n=1 Tax=Enterocloster hominis (ex Hitch et al. 2024) TaxID=1917870 RepID=UPI001D10440D|nr:GntR family transcriptional regulator [Lachnoclostridium pacaense]MCC2876803.1 GntR family transcriptional regulator [Lachnoclostridium pacaense]